MLHLPLNATVFACFNCMKFCHFGDRTKKKNVCFSQSWWQKKKKVTTRRPEFFFLFCKSIGLFQKNKTGGLDDIQPPGGVEERNSKGCSIKKKKNFQACSRKKSWNLHGYWFLNWNWKLGVSKECHGILQNFQGCKLVFSGIFKGKVKSLKIPAGFFRKVYPQLPTWNFSGITHCHVLTQL